MTSRLGDLYLIPNLLGETPVDTSLPPLVATSVSRLSHFVVENEKNARHFIKLLCPEKVIRDLTITTLNQHTKRDDIEALASPLRNGIDIGVISEAGCPGIADPGAELVRVAHALGAQVRPLVGPCSMTLALMASGFNGQRWRFLGYLPVETTERHAMIRGIERELLAHNETQIVMDTPYRNQKLFDDLITVCRPDTRVCIAAQLTTPEEFIVVKSVQEWRSAPLALPKAPALLLLGR